MTLIKQLKSQLKATSETDRANAVECITVFNKIKELSDGHVWSGDWTPMSSIYQSGDEWYHKLTKIGKLVLRGIAEEVKDSLEN